MRLTPERMERAAGVLVVVVILCIAGTFLLHLKEKGAFERKIHVHAYRADATGVSAGTGIKLLGLQVGEITGLDFDEARAHRRDPRPIRVDIAIQETMAPFIRSDFEMVVPATSAITAGIVGGVLELQDPDPETCTAPAIAEGVELHFKDSGPGLEDLLQSLSVWWEDHREGLDTMLLDVERTVSNVADPDQPLQQTLAHVESVMARLASEEAGVPSFLSRIHAILTSIEHGEGAAGALLSDPQVREDTVRALHQVRLVLEADLPKLVSGLVRLVEEDLPPILDTAKGLAGDVQTLTGVLADRPERITQLLDDVHGVLQQVQDALTVLLPILEDEAPSMVRQVQQSLDDANAMSSGVRRTLSGLGIAEPPPAEVEPELRQPHAGGRP